MIRAKAPHMLVTFCSMLRIGTVHSVPITPKPISSGRRPTRSERAPMIGCSSMNRNSEAAEIMVASALLICTVFTRYFCM
ncbi:hypothetical protein D3C76_1077370 [compost metagenome]